MNTQLKEILFGTLLGDASLQTYTGGKTWRARFIQSDSHKEYLFHLFDLFSPYVRTPPKMSEDAAGNKRWSFNTTVQSDLNEFGKYFYCKSNKTIPSNEILQLYLTPLAISFWFMDDGSRKSNCKSYYLCTDCFTFEDVKRIGEFIASKYNLLIGYHKKGSSYRIYISIKSYFTFRGLIHQHVHSSMYYKL